MPWVVLARPAPPPGLVLPLSKKPHRLQPVIYEEGAPRPPGRGATRRRREQGRQAEAEWKDDLLAPIRRLDLPGLGAGMRDKSTGSRHEKVRFSLSHKQVDFDHVLLSFNFRKRKQSEHHQRQQLQA